MIQTQPSTAYYSLESGLPASVRVSRFQGESGVEEYHIIVQPTEYDDVETQLGWIDEAYELALSYLEVGLETSVLRRFFCSDLVNQAGAMRSRPISDPNNADSPCAVSWVGQPPAPPAKVALWAYHIYDAHAELQKRTDRSSLTIKRGDLEHMWTTGVACPGKATSYEQTQSILHSYRNMLELQGLSLADNVIRTWFFVRDVDASYQGLVDARGELFARHGLTADTHYIASTGIEGTSADVAATVTMDAYAISGLVPDQIQFLSAEDFLSPTSVYGVTFERGVSVAYSDRKHILISGTASIDSEGHIVYPGCVLKQLDRTLQNIDALLREAGATFRDTCVFIVYVRDPIDVDTVNKALSERLGEAPYQIVVAPVCRPGWLIEIECQAVVSTSCPALPAF